MEWYLTSPEDTERAGALLATGLSEGCGVALEGELGAGKTCLTRGLVRGLWSEGEIPEDAVVSSPTYTLIQRYSLPRGRGHLLHADLYRLEDADDLESTGYWDEIDQATLWVVEWIDRIPDAFPGDGFHAVLTHAPEGRVLNLTWRGDVRHDWSSIQSAFDACFRRKKSPDV